MAGLVILDSGAYQGFVRQGADGTITVFNAPKAGTASGEGTQAMGINASGAIVGIYIDANHVYHGFLRF